MERNIKHEQLTLSLFKAMNSNDMSIIPDIADENIKFDFPGTPTIEGRKRFIIFLKALLRKYKTLQFTINEMIFEESKACLIWTNEGKYLNDSDYKNSGVTLFHFENDKIIFLSDYFKDTSFK